MLQKIGAGQPQTLVEEIKSVHAAYTGNPRKSIHRTSMQLQIPHWAIH